MTTDLELTVRTSLSMEEAESRLRAALQTEGFGILTEVDAAAVLKDKLGVEVPAYRILGACNPRIAHAAMEVWRGFGLIAPCHIAIYEGDDERVVSALDPTAIPQVSTNPRIYPLAQEAKAAIGRALEAL